MNIDLPQIIALATGPGSGFAILILGIVALVRWKYIVPGWVLERSEQINSDLELENVALNERILEKNEEILTLSVGIGKLEEKVKSLTEKVTDLTGEVSELRKMETHRNALRETVRKMGDAQQ